MKNLFDVAGKVALVTGGSRGIGRATAQALADRGARVMIVARKQETLTRTADEIGKGTDISSFAKLKANEGKLAMGLEESAHARFEPFDCPGQAVPVS